MDGFVKRFLLGPAQALWLLAAGHPVLAEEMQVPQSAEKYPQTLLAPVGTQAQEIFDAMAWDLVAITILFIVFSLVTAFILIRFKARRGDDSKLPQSHGDFRAEIAIWLGLIVGVVILLFHPLHAEGVFSAAPKNADAIDIEVIGHQWWWEFKYPNQKIVTANELHIPTGRIVRLKTTSMDVIHSFGAPRLGGKNDALPGRWTKFWMEVDEPGSYYGQCWELCGASHARMLFRVIAHPQKDYEAWVKARQNPVTKPASELAKQGEQVFGRVCAACHTVDGTPYQGQVGPNLTAVGKRTTIGGGVLKNTPKNLTTWISNPASVKPGSLMPNNIEKGLITQEDVPALVEYLSGLK